MHILLTRDEDGEAVSKDRANLAAHERPAKHAPAGKCLRVVVLTRKQLVQAVTCRGYGCGGPLGGVGREPLRRAFTSVSSSLYKGTTAATSFAATGCADASFSMVRLRV
jgi:hypothetical protein